MSLMVWKRNCWHMLEVDMWSVGIAVAVDESIMYCTCMWCVLLPYRLQSLIESLLQLWKAMLDSQGLTITESVKTYATKQALTGMATTDHAKIRE